VLLTLVACLQVTQVLSALSLIPRDGVTSSCNRAAEVLLAHLHSVDTVRCARLAAAAGYLCLDSGCNDTAESSMLAIATHTHYVIMPATAVHRPSSAEKPRPAAAAAVAAAAEW
jgi:hypothetical protein